MARVTRTEDEDEGPAAGCGCVLYCANGEGCGAVVKAKGFAVAWG